MRITIHNRSTNLAMSCASPLTKWRPLSIRPPALCRTTSVNPLRLSLRSVILCKLQHLNCTRPLPCSLPYNLGVLSISLESDQNSHKDRHDEQKTKTYSTAYDNGSDCWLAFRRSAAGSWHAVFDLQYDWYCS